jgi:hypothetical protein
MRRVLNGPQDLTITDGATDLVRQMWVRLGGVTADLASLRWIRVFRPWRYGGDELLRRTGLGRSRIVFRPLWALLDVVTRPIAARVLSTAPSEAVAEPLTPQAVVDLLPGFAGSLRLHPAYDSSYLEWLFSELERLTSRGQLVRSLVRQGDRALGWYVYFLRRGGISEVLQLAAGERDVDAVVGHMLHDARTRGAAALQGRMEPRLVESALSRRCLPAPNRWTLVHSRDPEILGAIGTRSSLLSRLEGEWWMGHHIERFS